MMISVKRWIMLLAAVGMLTGIGTGAAAAEPEERSLPGAQVFVPDGYEDEPDRRYPVLYILPEEETGTAPEAFLEGVLETASSEDSMDLIIVCPDPGGWKTDTWADLTASAKALIKEVDASFRTVDDPEYRTVAGAGSGGYLASMLAWTDAEGHLRRQPELFAMTGSVNGDYRSEGSWQARFGSFTEAVRDGRLTNAAAIHFYTFMRTASEEETAYMEDGANDVISLFIRLGSAYGTYTSIYGNADETVLDLQVVHGNADENFLKESARNLVKGISHRMSKRLISGEVSVPPVDEGTEEDGIIALASAQTAVTQDAALFGTDPENPGMNTSLEILETEEGSSIALTADFLGMKMKLAQAPVVFVKAGGMEPEEQLVDLMGEWYFKPALSVRPGELPAPEEYRSWEKVVPALDWWNSDFSTDTDMKGFAGYAWYVKEFEMPEHYPADKTYYLPMGCFDETDICFVNGQMVGCTGLDPDRWMHLEDCWDTERLYEAGGELFHFGQTNVITVLTHNASGDGGWYSGHPGVYSPEAYEALGLTGKGNDDRYEDVTFPFDTPAGDEAHALVYLPEGYEDPGNADRAYPVLYLLHQLNSTSRSYVLDGIDELLDEAIRTGEIGDLIVVLPDSSAESWWMYGWDDMVIEGLIPYIDENFRTIADAQHRYIGGASMGGHGAYHIALKAPDLFGGVISFYGALNMGSNPLRDMQNMGKEELGAFRHYFICGNRDLYKFGPVAMVLDQHLRSVGVDHWFELGEGGHDSAYYLPHFIEAIKYLTGEGSVSGSADKGSL